jgi:excinuclease ABC subunit C
VAEKQFVERIRPTDEDVFGLARAGTEEKGSSEACVQVFFIRGTQMVGRDFFTLDGVQDEKDADVLGSFLKQFYESAVYVPKHVVVPFAVPEASLIEEWLTEKRGSKVKITVAQRGTRRRLVELATENARESMDQLHVRWLSDSQKRNDALTQLQEELDLPTYPRRIECYDNSNIQGSSPVASMVVFIDGQPKNAEYRRFKIKTVVGANDFASMAEILGRRFKRWETNQDDAGQAEFVEDSQDAYEATEDDAELREVEAASLRTATHGPHGGEPIELATGAGEAQMGAIENAPRHGRPLTSNGGAADLADDERADEDLLGWGALPDLVIVDGGKGQLSAALDVMRNLGLQHVPLAGLAKQNEELFVQDLADPIVLPRTSQSLYLVQRIRDEAHRFAITFHRQVRAKSAIQSALDAVPGVGPKRKRALLRKFGSVKGIREASVEEIASTVGFTTTLASKVKEYL